MGCLRIVHDQRPELRVVHGKKAVTSSDWVKRVRSSYLFGMLMPGRHDELSGRTYAYGFNGMERDEEVKGAGNSYDFGARMQDPRLGRWLSVDPLQAKYPDLSSYSYVANNPLIYIDPDGREIKLAKGLTKDQKLEIVGTLQRLTNDRLVYKTLADGSGQIKIASLAKSGTETKVTGTNLIRELNSSERTVTIDYKNSLGTFKKTTEIRHEPQTTRKQQMGQVQTQL